MNEKDMKFVSDAIAKYNAQSAASHHTISIIDFTVYPEEHENGAKMALKFKEHRWGGDKETTLEYKNFEQLTNWFNYHT